MVDSGATKELATSIAVGTIYGRWWFYVIWMLVTAVGAALGVWLRERIRGDVTKQVWLSQERWKEKYRLYAVLVTASEEIAAALWNIVTDTRTLSQMNNANYSTEADGLRLFPEHKTFLDMEGRANDKLALAEVGIELMLNDKAKEAFQLIKGANTRSAAIANMTYRDRIETRCTAAAQAKAVFIEAAEKDLRL